MLQTGLTVDLTQVYRIRKSQQIQVNMLKTRSGRNETGVIWIKWNKIYKACPIFHCDTVKNYAIFNVLRQLALEQTELEGYIGEPFCCVG